MRGWKQAGVKKAFLNAPYGAHTYSHCIYYTGYERVRDTGVITTPLVSKFAHVDALAAAARNLQNQKLSSRTQQADTAEYVQAVV